MRSGWLYNLSKETQAPNITPEYNIHCMGQWLSPWYSLVCPSWHFLGVYSLLGGSYCFQHSKRRGTNMQVCSQLVSEYVNSPQWGTSAWHPKNGSLSSPTPRERGPKYLLTLWGRSHHIFYFLPQTAQRMQLPNSVWWVLPDSKTPTN